MKNNAELFEPCCTFLVRVIEDIRFTNVTGDRGGATAFGITQVEYDSYRDRHNQVRQSVRLITWPEAMQVYREDFWNPVCPDQMPDELRFPLFQWAVNHGVGGAITTLQRDVFGLQPEHFGTLDIPTMIKIHGQDPITTAKGLLKAQGAWYDRFVQNHPDQGQFLKGWHNRVTKTADFCGLLPLEEAA